MPNVSKVILNGTTLMDVTSATATADKIISPYTAMLADGVMTTGTGSRDEGNDRLPSRLDGSLSGSISDNTITKLTAGALRECKLITDVSFPNVVTLGSNVFMGCNSLASVYLPKANGASNYEASVFKGCTSLQKIALPSYTALWYTEFLRGCTNLEAVDCPMTFINWASNIFRDCTKFNTLVLRHTALVTINNTDHFINTPFANGGTGGTLYVPSALISSYQSATNWSTILSYANNSIQAIEGSYYETHYVDGTPIE